MLTLQELLTLLLQIGQQGLSGGKAASAIVKAAQEVQPNTTQIAATAAQLSDDLGIDGRLLSRLLNMVSQARPRFEMPTSMPITPTNPRGRPKGYATVSDIATQEVNP